MSQGGKNRSWISTHNILLTGVLAALVLALSQHRIGRLPASAQAAPRRGGTTPVRPAPHNCSTGSNEDIAWCEFKNLTDATTAWPKLPLPSSGEVPLAGRPLWTDWSDQCDLNLLSPSSCAQKAPPNQGSQPLPTELLSVNLPTQERRYARHGDDVALGEVLASVLFSPELAKSIAGLNSSGPLDEAVNDADSSGETGDQRQLYPDSLGDYSTAVKLMWEVVLRGSEPFPASVYVPVTPTPATLVGPIWWSTKYNIDPNEKRPCPPDNKFPPPSRPPPTFAVPVNCFYHFKIDLGAPGVQNQLTADRLHLLMPTFPRAKKGTPVVLILVGAHVMVFTRDHPAWRWMTFYWTKDSNLQANWANPWRHYQMMTTIIDSNGNLSRPQIANPYLEGHNDGMNTNCISCHSLAAYTNRGLLRNWAQDIVDAATVGPGYPATETTASDQAYFDHAIRTHFLWSIPDNPNLYAAQPSDVGPPQPPPEQSGSPVPSHR